MASITKDLDQPRRISRRLFLMTGTVTMSNSYTVGGEAFDPIPGGNYVSMTVEPVGGYIFEFDKTNKKLKVICPTGGVAPTTIGPPSVAVPSGATTVTSTAAQPNLVETGGQGVEMGAGANLSSLTSRYTAIAKV